MIQIALGALLVWPLVSLALFAALGPWRGAIATYLGAYLLLSGYVGIPMVGLPDYTKFTAANLGALSGILIFDARRLAAFRPRWFDALVLTLCLEPAASLLANGLPLWQGITAVSNMVIQWGAPYFVGRLYANRPGAARDLALGLVLAGGLLTPLIAFEVVTARSLSGIVYGIPIVTGYKYGLYNPVVMTTNSLELGIWSAVTSLVAFTLWSARSGTSLIGMPFGFWAAAAIGGTVLCHQTGAVALLGLGMFLIALTAGRRFGALPEWAAVAAVILAAPKLGGRLTLTALAAVGAMRFVRDRRPRLLIYAAALATPAYILLRVTNAVSRQTLTVAAYTLLGFERGYSLEYRIITEELMVAHVMHRPLFGWGTFAEGRGWAGGVTVVDSLWIIHYAQYGLIGLIGLYGLFCMPVLLSARRCPVETWDDPRQAPVAALAMSLVVLAMDSLMNAYIMLPTSVIAGLVIAVPAMVAGRPWAESEATDRGLARVDQLAARGRLAEAEAACLRLIAARAADPAGHAAQADACDRLADLLEVLGRSDHAEPPRRRALHLRTSLAVANPGDPGARAALAGCCERLARNLGTRGRVAEAIEVRGIALEQRAALAASAPDDPDALLAYADGLNDLAWMLAVAAEPADRDPARAVTLAGQAVRVGPGRKAYWNTLGAAYRSAGEPGPAVAALRQSLRFGPDEAGFDDALMALALVDLGDADGARDALAHLDARLARLGDGAPASLHRLRDEAAATLRLLAPAGAS